jgi:hypothetical protein
MVVHMDDHMVHKGDAVAESGGRLVLLLIKASVRTLYSVYLYQLEAHHTKLGLCCCSLANSMQDSRLRETTL